MAPFSNSIQPLHDKWKWWVFFGSFGLYRNEAVALKSSKSSLQLLSEWEALKTDIKI